MLHKCRRIKDFVIFLGFVGVVYYITGSCTGLKTFLYIYLFGVKQYNVTDMMHDLDLKNHFCNFPNCGQFSCHWMILLIIYSQMLSKISASMCSKEKFLFYRGNIFS